MNFETCQLAGRTAIVFVQIGVLSFEPIGYVAFFFNGGGDEGLGCGAVDVTVLEEGEEGLVPFAVGGYC